MQRTAPLAARIVGGTALVALLAACVEPGATSPDAGDTTDIRDAGDATDTGSDDAADEGSAADARGDGGDDTADDIDRPDVDVDDDAEPGDTAPDAGPPPWGLATRPANPTCRAFDRPTTDVDVRFSDPYNASFSSPVAAVLAPTDPNMWHIVERTGRIRTLPVAEGASHEDVTLFADLTDRVDASAGEAGLLDIAFAPDYAASGAVYVSYTAFVGAAYESRISRFTANADRTALDRSTESIILRLTQPDNNHNGGDIEFGPDGFLYIAFGDGGGAGDPYENGQNPNTWFAAILRIDPSRRVGARAYAIPADNPFADGVDGAPEVWAYGLRNPWRMSFDAETGELWAADVGQNAFEEINIIRRGANYGWPVYEGESCFARNPQCGLLAAEPPVHSYPHDVGRSITGGHVYRGTALPELNGAYVFADFVSGRVWALRPDRRVEELAGPGELGAVSSFGRDANGELYPMNLFTGDISRLDRATGAPPPAIGAPPWLSETGCVDADDPSRVADGLVPYGVNAPFWSDGARKDRWFAIPDGTTIAVGDDGDFDLPIGSVTVKRFWFGDDGPPFETRLLVRHDDGGWTGYSYRWDAAAGDARLVDERVVDTVEGRTWTFPSGADCLACHTEVAGRTLGLETVQLDGDFTYPNGARGNQLGTLRRVGLIGDTPALPPLPAAGDSATTAARAHAWLHTNCAYCHQPSGPGRGGLDLRWLTEDRHLCNVRADSDLGVPGARLVVPFRPDLSVLFLRARTRDTNAMPPLGTAVADDDGVALLEQWINAGGCD